MTARYELKAKLTESDCDRSYDRRSLCQADVLARRVKCYGCGRELTIRVGGSGEWGDSYEATLPRHKHKRK